MYDMFNTGPDVELGWSKAEGQLQCLGCDLPSDELMYNNDTGVIKVFCECGEVSEIFIGAGRDD